MRRTATESRRIGAEKTVRIGDTLFAPYDYTYYEAKVCSFPPNDGELYVIVALTFRLSFMLSYII